MRLFLTALVATVALAGCRRYEQWPALADQDGLMNADQYAGYGAEQAQKIAMGRKLAELYQGDSWEARAKQVEQAVAYAKSLPDVADVKADTTGYWLTVKFKSGWRAAVLPIKDGVAADATPGLTKK
ncbi:MAG: hypothetical protein NW201_08720 [Gemmatimonadales bacterium]|nr:hypothetical protein [Gemmatimonadales bacterium]